MSHRLSARFSAAERCPLIENSERDHQRLAGDYRAFRGYRYYAGHYGYDIFSQVAEAHLPVTNFREPVGRLYSLYRYFRFMVTVPDDAASRDNFYPVVFAQRYDFASFVSTDDPRIEVHTRNHHARQLSGSAWSPGSRAYLPQALRLLEQMPWYYICAYPALSAQWAAAVFGADGGGIPRDNVTQGGQAMGARSAERRCILDKNALDLELYRAAERRLLGWANTHAQSLAMGRQGLQGCQSARNT